MATRDIRPSTAHTICDVCGRTLLRGERADPYLQGGARLWVCELCKPRALHEGWIREGTVPEYDPAAAGTERRRSLFARWRARRSAAAQAANGRGRPYEEPPRRSPATGRAEPGAGRVEPGAGRSGRATPPPSAAPAAPAGGAPLPSRIPKAARRPRPLRGEPRHVRAVPSSPEQKMVAALERFNSSAHTRTVSGVARALGLPTVSVIPSSSRQSLVQVVASWELCWYRYEVDLSEELPAVRVAAQGYELDELPPEERHPNADADENGLLELRPIASGA